jgi:hypothetical protein
MECKNTSKLDLNSILESLPREWPKKSSFRSKNTSCLQSGRRFCSTGRAEIERDGEDEEFFAATSWNS